MFFLDLLEQAGFSVRWPSSMIIGVIETNFLTFKSIYFKSVNSGPKFKATISHNICYARRLYIFLLVCKFFPITSKRGGCSNVLESSPTRIPLIESSHKWTRILFILSNSEFGIWIFSQNTIEINSQSNLYAILTLDRTILFLNFIYPGFQPMYNQHNQNTFYIYFLRILDLADSPLCMWIYYSFIWLERSIFCLNMHQGKALLLQLPLMPPLTLYTS